MPLSLREFLDSSAADMDDAMAASLWTQLTAQAMLLAKAPPGSQPGRSRNIERGFEQGHLRIMLDYFWPTTQVRPDGSNMKGPVYTEEQFERRFRMPRRMFNKILVATTAECSYLRAGLQPNCTCRLGASPLQKIVAAMRQLAYGCSADSLDEYCRLGESTALRSMKEFCRSVVSCFEGEFLREPTEEELRKIENQFSSVGFPGCIGSVDCAGWQWGNCPKGLQGIMVGKEGVPTLRMEVIADLNLRIWHLAFGLPGVMNDLNILSVSDHFGKILSGAFPRIFVSYTVDGEEFDWLYYLADGIYPNYKVFAKTVGTPTTRKQTTYSAIQEGARKSVERVFGVLFKQFAILFQPGRLWFSEEMTFVMKACCILHNMTVEERVDGFVGDGVGGIRAPNAPNKTSEEITGMVSLETGMLGLHSDGSSSVKSSDEHFRLKTALVNHVWEMHGSG